MKNNIAVIGLGSMGYGIATSCLQSGHLVWGVDTNIDQVNAFCSQGGQATTLNSVIDKIDVVVVVVCLLYTSPSPRDAHESRMPSSA